MRGRRKLGLGAVLRAGARERNGRAAQLKITRRGGWNSPLHQSNTAFRPIPVHVPSPSN